MKATLLSLAVLVASVIVCGCNPDKSGDIQKMPSSAAAPNQSPTNPNLSPEANKAISSAAPRPSGN